MAPSLPPHWVALAVLTAARTSLGFQFQSVASVSSGLVAEVGLNWAEVGTLIGLYFLPGVVVALPGAALGQRFGDRTVVVFGLVLMVAGGLVCSAAEGFATLAAGRVLSGVGAVMLNVLMAKMVTDWFAGRDGIVLAMAIFVNSFPIGIGLALLVLGPVQDGFGWQPAMAATSAFAAAAMVLVVLGYRRHGNDGMTPAASRAAAIGRREVMLVSVAGAIWGVYNGVFAVMFGFAPHLLAAAGFSAAAAGFIAGTTTWITAGSIQAGGMIAQSGIRPGLLMVAGSFGWAVGLFVMTMGGTWSAPAMIAAGVLMGLPVGVIMSLPAQVLQPQNRSIGMGIFYTWLYVGHGSIPPVAGWLQDRTGSIGAPMVLAAILAGCMPLLYAAFQRGRRR